MGAKTNRTLYIGTNEGLYRAEVNGDGNQVQPLGLQGKGPIRAPVVIDRSDPRRVYAATSRAGMWRSEDGGKNWREINEGVVYKEAWSLAQHPRTGELYVGTGPSSVFKSTDGGDTWSECEQLKTLPETEDWTFPHAPFISHVKGLSLCAEDPLFIFGAIEEGWLIRSRDGGKSWQNIKQGTEFDSHSVTIMPDNPRLVISTSGNGVFRSFNGGDSFEESSQGLDCRYLAQLVVHPARPKVLFTAAAEVPPPFWRRPEGAASAFYRSEDQGTTWHRLSGGLPEHFKAAPRATAGDPEDPDVFFVGMTDGTVWMSDNGGGLFRQVLKDLPQVTSLRVTHQ